MNHFHQSCHQDQSPKVQVASPHDCDLYTQILYAHFHAPCGLLLPQILEYDCDNQPKFHQHLKTQFYAQQYPLQSYFLYFTKNFLKTIVISYEKVILFSSIFKSYFHAFSKFHKTKKEPLGSLTHIKINRDKLAVHHMFEILASFQCG